MDILYGIIDSVGIYTLLEILIAAALIIVLIALVRTARRARRRQPGREDAAIRRAGQKGEEAATGAILQVLRPDDFLLTNVEITYLGKDTELDDVIVNRYGVFIIEVKNYKGRLVGSEEDYEWDKYKDDGYGNTFAKKVKNPIKQVKRQVYILAKHLQFYGLDVWVEGYAILLQGNSPVSSKYVLSDIQQVDRAIHSYGKRGLDPRQIEAVKRILTRDRNRS